jgi:hypothetical protein
VEGGGHNVDEMDRGSLGTYVASAALADLIRDLRERDLLTGEVRESVIASLNQFIAIRNADPQEAWHVALFDLYEELTGQPPGK